MSEPTPCPGGELTITEVPPCPACEEMMDPVSYTIDFGDGVWTEAEVAALDSMTLDIDPLGYVNGTPSPMIPPDWSLTIVSPDDRHHAEILATALDEQGCPDDAELVRRLAGLGAK